MYSGSYCLHDAFPFNPVSPTVRTSQSAMPASGQFFPDLNSALAAREIKPASFLNEHVHNKTTSLHALIQMLTVFKEEKQGQNS